MDYSTMPEGKKRFFIEADDGGALMNLNLTRIYTKVEGKTVYIRGLEMDLLEKKEFPTNVEAEQFDKDFWLNLKNVLDYNNEYLINTYSSNPTKYKMLFMKLQNNIKRFFDAHQKDGYYF